MTVSPSLDLRPHALYRFYGPGETLLYVGITADLPARIKRHNEDKAWWLSITNITIEHFHDRPSVLEAERRAIVAEKPLYNEQHNAVTPKQWGSDGPTGERKLTGFHVFCMGCGDNVSRSSRAAIHLSYDEINRAETAIREHEKDTERKAEANGGWAVFTRSDLFEIPKEASWLIHCDQCNPHRDYYEEDGSLCERCYWFSVDRCSTWSDLVEWTSHLADKDWFRFTNWTTLLGYAARSGRLGSLSHPNPVAMT